MLISPGHADNSITIPLGYGRDSLTSVGESSGFNGYLLRTASNPHYIVADGKAIESIAVKKVGEKISAFDHAGSFQHRRPRVGPRSDA